MTLTFIGTEHFYWCTVPHRCWGLKQLTKQTRKKTNQRKICWTESQPFTFLWKITNSTNLSEVCGSLPPSTDHAWGDSLGLTPLHSEHHLSPLLVSTFSSLQLRLEQIFLSLLANVFTTTFLPVWSLTLLSPSVLMCVRVLLCLNAVGMVLMLSPCCRGRGKAGGGDGAVGPSVEVGGSFSSCSSSAPFRWTITRHEPPSYTVQWLKCSNVCEGMFNLCLFLL